MHGPHNSRQRIDLTHLKHFQSVSPDAVLPALLGKAKTVTIPAKVPQFRIPAYPESEWSEEQKAARNAYEQQQQLLKKLHDIAVDAQEYVNDHGEGALYLGYPLISLPPKANDKGFRSSRIIAPLTLIPRHTQSPQRSQCGHHAGGLWRWSRPPRPQPGAAGLDRTANRAGSPRPL